MDKHIRILNLISLTSAIVTLVPWHPTLASIVLSEERRVWGQVLSCNLYSDQQFCQIFHNGADESQNGRGHPGAIYLLDLLFPCLEHNSWSEIISTIKMESIIQIFKMLKSSNIEPNKSTFLWHISLVCWFDPTPSLTVHIKLLKPEYYLVHKSELISPTCAESKHFKSTTLNV